MNTQSYLATYAGIITAAANAYGAPVKLPAVEKPNILFIFADDFSYEAIGALGKTCVKTPNLDRLMNSGVLFTHAYNMGSWTPAVCAASRSMLNSGMMVNRCQEGLMKHPTWSELMHDGGYKTYFTGKWHVPKIKTPRFDVVRHVRPGMPNQTPEGYNRPKNEEDYKNGWKPWDKSKGGYWKGGTHWTVVVGNDAEDFLNDAEKQDKPFFIYLAFNAAHDPRQSPKKYIDMYPLEKIKLPKNFEKENKYKDGMGCPARLRDERLAPFPRTEYSIKVNRQEYYAAITFMDEQVGRILDNLEKSGKADSTYIIFTTDQGLSVGHHGLMGKQNFFDPAARVPFFIAGPGIPKGEKIDTPIYLQDAMPTVLQLAGINVPDWVEFKSILPLIEGKPTQHYTEIYGKYLHYQRMIQKGDYKLIAYPMIKQFLLFNMKKDPDEMNNLADNPEYATLLASMKNDLKELMKQMGDSLNLDNPEPPPTKKRHRKKKKTGIPKGSDA